MEIRNHSKHLHFIHVIKKGTVIELMNQSPSGVPPRKFRNIEDIYGDEDSVGDISLVGRKLRKKYSASDRGFSRAGIKILFHSEGDSIWSESLRDETACNTDTDNYSSDDLTLRKLKDKCRKIGKKRKAPASDSGNEASHVEMSQPNDDETDLKQPLRLLLSNIRKKRTVNIVANPDLLSPSLNTKFDNNQQVNFDGDQSHQVESAPEHCMLADVPLQLTCSPIEAENTNSSFSLLNHMDVDPNNGDLPGKTANCSQSSEMTNEEHTSSSSLVQIQESSCCRSYCSTTQTPLDVITVHKESEKHEYSEGADQNVKQEWLYPVSKMSLQEDDNVSPSYNNESPIDLPSNENDISEPQCSTSEICSEAGQDLVNQSHEMKTIGEAEIMAKPVSGCQIVQKLCSSPLTISKTNVQSDIHVTLLPGACLDALSNSVDHISDKHGKSKLCCIGNWMESEGPSNLVKSDQNSDRLMINMESKNVVNCERNLPVSHECLPLLPVSEVNVQEDINMTSLLDELSGTQTSTVDQISDNDDPVAPCNANQMTPAAQTESDFQQIDDQPAAVAEYEVNIHEECPHKVKEIIDDAKTSNLRVILKTNSHDKDCQPANSILLCYSDSAVPANQTAQTEEQSSVTFSSITDTKNSTVAGSCDSIDKPFELERLQQSKSYGPVRSLSGRKAIPPSLQKEAPNAMEDIDLIDSREKLRSFGKLFSEKQNKHKKPSISKGTHIRETERVHKSDMSNIRKHSEQKRNVTVSEQNHSGVKMPQLPRSLARAKKRDQMIQSCPEGAIVFSKRQMQDIEALARKLTNELSCMKEIIEERLNNVTGTSDQNNDQIVAAIRKASKAEATARKWLSTMNRDCIRFCTIMKISSENSKDAESSRTVTQKKDGKKITFADEAGGQLCEVKLIESVEVTAPAPAPTPTPAGV